MSAQVERAAWLIQARIPETRTGLSVAVIGSGPAGLACADVLNQQAKSNRLRKWKTGPAATHVRDPNMKLDKASGKTHQPARGGGHRVRLHAEIGKNANVETIRNANDAWCCVPVLRYRGTTRARAMPRASTSPWSS